MLNHLNYQIKPIFCLVEHILFINLILNLILDYLSSMKSVTFIFFEFLILFVLETKSEKNLNKKRIFLLNMNPIIIYLSNSLLFDWKVKNKNKDKENLKIMIKVEDSWDNLGYCCNIQVRLNWDCWHNELLLVVADTRTVVVPVD